MHPNQIENSKKYSVLVTILVLIVCLLFCALAFYINSTNQQNAKLTNNLSNSTSSLETSYNLSDEIQLYTILSTSDLIVSMNDKTKKVFMNSHTILEDEIDLRFQAWLQENNYQIPSGYTYYKCDKICNESLFAKPDSVSSEQSDSATSISSLSTASQVSNNSTTSNAN